MITMLGDLDAVPAGIPENSVILAWPGALIGEITAQQIPRLTGHTAEQVVVCLGTANVLAGDEESFVHAELVALCDAPLLAAPRARAEVRGFPPVSGYARQVQLFSAAAQAVCELRGITWHPYSTSRECS